MPNKNSRSSILVTGTAGFIGFHLVEPLVLQGYRVLGLDVINDYYDQDLKYGRLEESGISRDEIEYGKTVGSSKYPGYHFIKLDLNDREHINRLFADNSFSTVIHLAAQAGVRYSLTNPYAYLESNISGFMNILEACRHHMPGHLIFASSSSVYGLNKSMPFSVHDNVDHPISLYATSKKSNELMAHTYAHLYGIPVTGLRFFTVYGPWGRPDMALYLFTKAIFEGKPIDVYNRGMMERDFTYIEDIIQGMIKMMESPPPGNEDWNALEPDPSSSPAPYKLYNIGNNSPVKLLDFIKAIENHTGRKAVLNLCEIQPGDVVKTWADTADLIQDFNYAPVTSIDDGIRAFVDWFKTYYKLES